ncbi:MAG: HD domain-containing protein [Lachnospiraceae bacterium]|nr:HD domain-containing protein [Lachnospiraceae bacterium]
MQGKIFAAIHIGSYAIEMKIFSMSAKTGIKELDHIKSRMELGRDIFRTHKIRYEFIDNICTVLNDFVRIMKEYRTDSFRVCATAAIREADNSLIVLEQIRVRTGLTVEILSNSEQRYYEYKSIALGENEFQKIIQKGTAIVDVGEGNIQLSLFDKDKLITTQSIMLGALRMQEKLSALGNRASDQESIIEEMIENELRDFSQMYIKDRKIENIIAVGDPVTYMIKLNGGTGSITKDAFLKLYDQLHSLSPAELADNLDIPPEIAAVTLPSLIVYKRFVEDTGAQSLFTLGIHLADGLAYEYAEQRKLAPIAHDFENDIIAAAKSTAKRYMNAKSHTSALEKAALAIFDGMKKVHGLGNRERLLLRIAVILHDCGKYISMSRNAECSYHIIMATEIIGLSHREREIIANTVKYNTADWESFASIADRITFEKKDYLLIAKLTAILRLANALDRSHRQKFKDIKAVLRDSELIVTVDTAEDMTLEMTSFSTKIAFFEEVYSIRPVLKQKRSW